MASLNRRIGFGIIGAGGIARRRILPAFKTTRHAKLAAICSRSLSLAGELASDFEGVSAFDSPAEMVAHPAVEAVYIATPVHLHLEHVRLAARAGKHILLEKPLAGNLPDATQIVEEVEAAGVLAMEAFMMRFHPAHQKIKALLEKGVLGKITYARARLSCWYPPDEKAWRQKKELSGGGALMDLGPHLLNLLTFLFGPSRRVQGFASSQIFSGETDNHATLLLEFSSGIQGVIEASFCVPDALGGGELEIVGTTGRILAEQTIGQNGAGIVRLWLNEEQKSYEPGQKGQAGPIKMREEIYEPFDLYAAELDTLSECILRSVPPAFNTMREGLESMKVLQSIYNVS